MLVLQLPVMKVLTSLCDDTGTDTCTYTDPYTNYRVNAHCTLTFSRTIIITDTIIGVACSCSTDSGNGGCCDGDRNSRRYTLSVLPDVLTGNGDSPPSYLLLIV